MKSDESPLVREACSERCRAPVTCTVCKMRKAPVGRSVPMEAANGYCNWECEGYDRDPKPGHLWPNEDLP